MKKLVLCAALASLLWGCATVSPVYRQGAAAEMNKKYDEAIRYYEQAALEHPSESVYRLALIRAKAGAALYHLQLARSSIVQGDREKAIAEFKIALTYDPLNRVIYSELRALETPPSPPEAQAPEAGAFPVRLKGTGERLTLNFPSEISLKSIYRTLGKMTGVNILYDEQFRDINMSADLTGRDLEQAVSYLCLASKNFFRVIDEKTVIIVPDQPLKRMQYELNGIRTFYLSNLNAKDVQGPLAQLTRSAVNPTPPNIQVDNVLNTLTIRGNPQALALAEKLIRKWDKAAGEVIVELEIMEVSRQRLQQLGIDFSQEGIALRFNPEGAGSEGWYRLNNLNLGDAGNYELSFPSAVLQFLEGDADTKMIAQPRLRGVAGEEMKYLVGQKVPVPQASFNPIAAGGLATQPVVQYNLQDVGIDIKLKPRIHLENEVTLEVEIKISSIAGTGVAGIPIIGTREVKNIVRLRDGETNLLAGLLKDEERKSVSGIVGIKDIPLIGNIFSRTEIQIEQTDIVLTLTPYIIRSIPLTDEDMKTLWVDSDSLSAATGASQMALEEQTLPRQEVMEPPPIEPPQESAVNAVFLTPASLEAARERDLRISLALRAENDVSSISIGLSFDPRLLQLKDVVEGGIVRQLGENVPFLKNIDNSGGSCTIGFSGPSLGRGFKGGGVLAQLVFTTLAPGETMITITSCTGSGISGQPITFDTGDTRILVR